MGPYRLQWLAALRSPTAILGPRWMPVWRKTSKTRKPCSSIIAEAPEIGATAAGLLLTRHGERPEAFGLQDTGDSQLAELKLPGFRYGARRGRTFSPVVEAAVRESKGQRFGRCSLEGNSLRSA